MSNDEDFLERAERISLNWSGTELTPEKVLHEFQLHGPARRSQILDQIDEQARSAPAPSLNQAAKRVSLLRQMRNFHHAARKVGR